ncbi:MAG: hypothetical protein Q7V63_02755 [Gammaproteobacteria bacterium]|nr:hypothetical protein [Gammaproteobacteria bacterium]
MIPKTATEKAVSRSETLSLHEHRAKSLTPLAVAEKFMRREARLRKKQMIKDALKKFYIRQLNKSENTKAAILFAKEPHARLLPTIVECFEECDERVSAESKPASACSFYQARRHSSIDTITSPLEEAFDLEAVLAESDADEALSDYETLSEAYQKKIIEDVFKLLAEEDKLRARSSVSLGFN